MIKIFPFIFIILWSSAFITTKPIIDNSDPFAALAFRFFFVAVGFLLFSLYSKYSIIIKRKTGKSSFNYITEEVSKNNKENQFNKDFKDLIEKRVKIVHQKLVDQNNETKIIKDFKLLVEKRVKLTHNKLIQQKINR